MPIPFIDLRLDESVSEGSQGGPGFKTSVFEADSGAEQRNSNWSVARSRYDVSYGIRDEDDFMKVLTMFYACRGRASGFRFKDWGDYRLQNEVIKVANGTDTEFQITKTYSIVGAPVETDYVRVIKKPVEDTIIVFIDGVEVTSGLSIDYSSGVITFDAPPAGGAEISVTGQFDVPVRFDIDQMEISWEAHRLNSSSGIEVVELKDIN